MLGSSQWRNDRKKGGREGGKWSAASFKERTVAEEDTKSLCGPEDIRGGMLKGAAGGVRGPLPAEARVRGDLISQEEAERSWAGVLQWVESPQVLVKWDRARGQSRASLPQEGEACLQLRRAWRLQEGVLRDCGPWGHLGL